MYVFLPSAERVADKGVLTSLSADTNTACATMSWAGSNNTYCWGYNPYGGLGNNTTTNSSSPVQVQGLTYLGSSRVYAGSRSCSILNSQAGVACWGYGVYGQLGNGGNTSSSTAALISLRGIISMALGAYHTCALDTAGKVDCWGANGSGQLGFGDTTTRTTPSALTALTSPTAEIAAAGNSTCARTAASAVYCCGENLEGQVGDGSAQTRLSPVQVQGLPAAAVSVRGAGGGGGHYCAQLADASVWCWGLNVYGQLGDGTHASRFAPVRMQL